MQSRVPKNPGNNPPDNPNPTLSDPSGTAPNARKPRKRFEWWNAAGEGKRKMEDGEANTAGSDSAIVFLKMAPRKGKNLGKRNNIKIKSKVNRQKGRLKSSKKFTPKDKPLDTLMWMNKLGPDGSVGKSGAVPDWLDSCSHKLKDTSNSSDSNPSAYEDYQNGDAEKYSVSDASEECNCSQSRYLDSGKEKSLKKKIPSTSSLVTKYIKSGMNQVASFIVESAIRFGEQHGVVIPDKSSPNVYEITLPTRRFDDKFKKIRFKVPEKAIDYDGMKKVKWRGHKGSKDNLRRAQTPMPSRRTFRPSKSSSFDSGADSLEEILPILEKLKDGGDTITSDLDLQKLRGSDVSGRTSTRERDRERNRSRDRGRERERDRSRDRGREKERLRERLRSMGKRYKSLAGGDDECPDEDMYPSGDRSPWKKYKRDSVELVRQRLRNGAKELDQESSSTTPY